MAAPLRRDGWLFQRPDSGAHRRHNGRLRTIGRERSECSIARKGVPLSAPVAPLQGTTPSRFLWRPCRRRVGGWEWFPSAIASRAVLLSVAGVTAEPNEGLAALGPAGPRQDRVQGGERHASLPSLACQRLPRMRERKQQKEECTPVAAEIAVGTTYQVVEINERFA